MLTLVETWCCANSPRYLPVEFDVFVDHVREIANFMDRAGLHGFVLAQQQPRALIRQVAENPFAFVDPEFVEIGFPRLQHRGRDRRFELRRHLVAIAADRRRGVTKAASDLLRRNSHRE